MLFLLLSVLQLYQEEEGEEDPGKSQVGGLTPVSPTKKTGKAQRQSSPPDIQPAAGGETENAAMTELLLDILSYMNAIEEYVVQ